MFASNDEQNGLPSVKSRAKVKPLKATYLFWKRSLAIGLASAVAVGVLTALETTPSPQSAPATEPAPVAAKHPLAPGPNDGRIAYVTAQLLSTHHFSHHLLDDELSEKFFDRYLDMLDPQHLHFTQADITEFEYYRDKLDDLTDTGKRTGDATPAFDIFNRFLQRLEQRIAVANEWLKAGRFDFTDEERMQINRKDAPYPKNLAEAKELWRQRVRHEYLQEKLGKHSLKIKDEGVSILSGRFTNSVTGEVTEVKPDKQPAAPVKEVKKKTEAEELTETLTKRYARNLKLFKEWDNDDVMQVYLTALAHVYDPHSDYMNKSQADNFAIGMNNILFGIGAVLTTDLDGFCKIQELKPGPASNSKKLKAGDRIVAVAQSNAPPVDAIEMALNKVVSMIRGPKGTEVRLTIQPANADASDRYVLPLIRDEIKLEDQAAKGKVIEIPNGKSAPVRLGVIDLPSFYAPMDFGMGPQMLAAADGPAHGRFTSKDVASLLKKFEKEKVAGVILDLRRNGGGSLEEAVKLTGLFIKSGPVVQVKSSDGTLFLDEDEDPSVTYDGPLIVLTSRFSASASEIVAGALQDYGRALIVGDQSTHGKGTVQRVYPLRPWVKPATATATNDPGQLKVTMSKFYRASGASTQLKGVLPDIVLPSVLNYSEDIGEAALEYPLEWDTIRSARYEKLELVTPYLAELLKRSTARVSTNQDYIYINEDIAQFRKVQADKTITLNEAQRLKEKEEGEARQKARDKERLARLETPKVIYELALKHVDEPGLPAPVAKTNSLTRLNPGKGGAVLVGTNAAAASVKSLEPITKTVEDDEDEEKAPAVDASLEETEHILLDYITLLTRKSLLSAQP